MTYVETVIYDDIHDCYLLPFSDELLNELGWEIGDTLIWCVEGETVCLRKYEDQSIEVEED